VIGHLARRYAANIFGVDPRMVAQASRAPHPNLRQARQVATWAVWVHMMAFSRATRAAEAGVAESTAESRCKRCRARMAHDEEYARRAMAVSDMVESAIMERMGVRR